MSDQLDVSRYMSNEMADKLYKKHPEFVAGYRQGCVDCGDVFIYKAFPEGSLSEQRIREIVREEIAKTREAK